MILKLDTVHAQFRKTAKPSTSNLVEKQHCLVVIYFSTSKSSLSIPQAHIIDPPKSTCFDYTEDYSYVYSIQNNRLKFLLPYMLNFMVKYSVITGLMHCNLFYNTIVLRDSAQNSNIILNQFRIFCHTIECALFLK